jgi:tetratricopeptide (TPR) repeat protein
MEGKEMRSLRMHGGWHGTVGLVILGVCLLDPQVVRGGADVPTKELPPEKRRELEQKAKELKEQAVELYDKGRIDEAVSRSKQAVSIFERLHHDAHPDLARSLDYLGSLLYDQGQYDKAKSLFERALAMNEKLYPASRFPDGHPDLVRSLNNLGRPLLPQSKDAKAKSLCERALAMAEKLYPASRFPDGHSDLVRSLDKLGGLFALQAFFLQGQYAKAQPFYERALAMTEKLYPPSRFPNGHIMLSFRLRKLAGLLQAQGKDAEAQPLLERAQAIQTLPP